MPIPEDSKLQEIKKKIEMWTKRAAMSKKKGYTELEQLALERKRDYEIELAQLQETELD
ncbi:MAG TPA: hypothetical protein V6C89_14330 [Drouetiella sp.]|jgi:hypothetical protein